MKYISYISRGWWTGIILGIGVSASIAYSANVVLFTSGETLTADKLNDNISAINDENAAFKTQLDGIEVSVIDNDNRLIAVESLVRIILGSNDKTMVYNGGYVFTPVKYETSAVDGFGFYATGGISDQSYTNGRFTAPRDGIYRVTASVSLFQESEANIEFSLETRVYQSNSQADEEVSIDYNGKVSGPALDNLRSETAPPKYMTLAGSALFNLIKDNVLEVGVRGGFNTLTSVCDPRVCYLMIEELP